MRSSFLVKYRRMSTARVAVIILILAVSTSLSFLSFSVAGVENSAATAPNRSKSPTDIPSAPLTADRVTITLVTEEVIGQLGDGVTYTYWTFNGTVPGPMIRLRLDQTVELHIKNLANSTMTHSIDSHAILGTGGGSVYSQTPPGQESVFQFKALRVGLFMYHCATPDIPTHIANGMYGMILVEPKEGLPKVNREFYLAQGEFYTSGPFGQQGHQDFSFQKADAANPAPEYVVFNGRVGSLTGNGTLHAKVGETVRIFFLDAGPNLISSFHVIGGILDRVYLEGSIVSPPLLNVQTTVVPAGGAVMVEFTAEVPGTLTLVDHALFRIHRGALGMVAVSGPPNPADFSSIKNATQTSTGSMTSMPGMTTTVVGTTNQGQTNTSNSSVVTIVNFAYNPADLTIYAGTTVTWVNKDTVGHTVTEGKGDSPKIASQRAFDSSHGTSGPNVIVIPSGQSWSFTFTTPGEYDYYCIPHPYMRGHITVLPSGTSNRQSYGYGDLSNFSILLTGRELIALSAFGIVVLVGIMLVFARKTNKTEQDTN
jgi:copper-containing nitrite reductase